MSRTFTRREWLAGAAGAALLTGCGGLGLLLPPSLPLILYAIVASTNTAGGGGVTIEKMFLGGLGPAADHALADAISRWWAEVVPVEGLTRSPDTDDEFPPIDASSAEGFALVGLRVTG